VKVQDAGDSGEPAPRRPKADHRGGRSGNGETLLIKDADCGVEPFDRHRHSGPGAPQPANGEDARGCSPCRRERDQPAAARRMYRRSRSSAGPAGRVGADASSLFDRFGEAGGGVIRTQIVRAVRPVGTVPDRVVRQAIEARPGQAAGGHCPGAACRFGVRRGPGRGGPIRARRKRRKISAGPPATRWRGGSACRAGPCRPRYRPRIA
jgi:hypothetical protein